jgi:hypothetical protein
MTLWLRLKLKGAAGEQTTDFPMDLLAGDRLRAWLDATHSALIAGNDGSMTLTLADGQEPSPEDHEAWGTQDMVLARIKTWMGVGSFGDLFRVRV